MALIRIIRRATILGMDKKALGERILALRSKAGLSQEELAAKANIGNRVLQRIESGNHNPTINTLDSIAKALNASIPGGLGLTVTILRSPMDVTPAVSFLSAFDGAAPDVQKVILALLHKDLEYAKDVSREDLFRAIKFLSPDLKLK